VVTTPDEGVIVAVDVDDDDDRPTEVWGLFTDPTGNGACEGGSILIFPIDIFFRNPQRLPFSFPSLIDRAWDMYFPSWVSCVPGFWKGEDALFGVINT
jgi:hypothetical protein